MDTYRSTLAGCCLLLLLSTTATAGINSKEVGAVLFFPEYRVAAGDEECPDFLAQCGTAGGFVETYITITNDRPSAVNAHIEVIGGEACDDCNFDLPLTGFQTKRLWFRQEPVGGTQATVIRDASPHSVTGVAAILAACPEPQGFVVVTLEAFGEEPRRTLGENMLHGDAVIVDLLGGTAVQFGAIAVQGVGPNDGDRHLRFDNLEYAAFPSILTGNFRSPNDYVEPHLVLFNSNFRTGIPPVTSCSVNYVNAEEVKASRSLLFGCWAHLRLRDLGPGLRESILGTANGFLWAACDAGTHGAMLTDLNAPSPVYPYPAPAAFADTLFQSPTTNTAAELWMTPDISGTP